MINFNDLTEFQQDNLIKLRKYLVKKYGNDQYSPYFNMENFCKHGMWEIKIPNNAICNTCCCLAGHGPQANIPALEGERWADYISRVFGLDILTHSWDFLFSHFWKSDIQFAIWRLDKFINGHNCDLFSYKEITNEYYE